MVSYRAILLHGRITRLRFRRKKYSTAQESLNLRLFHYFDRFEKGKVWDENENLCLLKLGNWKLEIGQCKICRYPAVLIERFFSPFPQLLTFLRRRVPKGACPLAGNSVHADKKFLIKHMPRVNEHLHYRIIDVTSLSMLVKRWFPKEHDATPRKINTHRAKGDIVESIDQLKYLRRAVFK